MSDFSHVSASSDTGSFWSRHYGKIIIGVIIVIVIIVLIVVFVMLPKHPAEAKETFIGKSGSFKLKEGESVKGSNGRSLEILDGELYLTLTDPNKPETKYRSNIGSAIKPAKFSGIVQGDVELRFAQDGQLCLYGKISGKDTKLWCVTDAPITSDRLPLTLQFGAEYNSLETVDKNGQRHWKLTLEFKDLPEIKDDYLKGLGF